MNDLSGSILLTGATGFLGGQVLARQLEGSDRHVYAVVRARDGSHATERLREAVAAIYGSADAYAERLTAIAADLERPGLGLDRRVLDELAEQVTDVVHAAASIDFGEPLELARKINVAGTERMLELAELCQRRGELRRFVYVSTTYVAGTYDGHFREQDVDVGQTFRNSYERSKFEAEQLVRGWTDRIPVSIFRPGIIVGESRSGWTPAFNVLYYPIKLFAKGVNPPIVPARRATPIDAVPIDYVADAMFSLLARPGPSGETFHLVAAANASTVGELLDTSARYFGRRPPVLIPLRAFTLTLQPVMKRAYRGARKRQLDRGAEFLPYFSMRQTFDDRGAAAEGLHAPPLHSYFGRLLDFAVASKWGRRPMTRDEARARAGEAADRASASVEAQ